MTAAVAAAVVATAAAAAVAAAVVPAMQAVVMAATRPAVPLMIMPAAAAAAEIITAQGLVETVVDRILPARRVTPPAGRLVPARPQVRVVAVDQADLPTPAVVAAAAVLTAMLL